MTDKIMISLLTENGLKVTMQRKAVLEALMILNDHPSAENIIDYVRLKFPDIPQGTIYNILDTFVKKGIIEKVKTSGGMMRYDRGTERHHHLYCSDSDRIADYFDKDLDKILLDYFSKKKIKGFKIEDFRLQITGKFEDLKQD